MSPIYLDISLALWSRLALSAIYSSNPKPDDLDRKLSVFARRELSMRSADGKIVGAYSKNRSNDRYDEIQREIANWVDYFLPNSFLEAAAMQRSLSLVEFPFSVVPYAAEPSVFLDADPQPFIDKYGLKDFILQVGRVEPSKNQILTARALAGTDIPVVFIGATNNARYLEFCTNYGPKNLRIIPHLPHAELCAAYAAARVHVLPSWVETCGLVTMEAALADCNTVVSTVGYEVEYYRDLSYYCDPADIRSIRDATMLAFERYNEDEYRRCRLKQLILAEYTWPRAAQRTMKAYEHVLRFKS
jgi:glycosyltransferase involved in cell wall biosynthesis